MFGRGGTAVVLKKDFKCKQHAALSFPRFEVTLFEVNHSDPPVL